jgi:flagellar biosynthesis protein FliP
MVAGSQKVANEIRVNEAFERGSGPLRGFMGKNVREKDLQLFMDMPGEAPPKGVTRRPGVNDLMP